MKNYILMIILLYTLQGCAPLVIGTAATSSVVATQERTAGDALDDATITTKIKSSYFNKDFNNLFASINVITTEGRVLLTGYVPSIEIKDEAVEIAWQIKGVKDVLDELQIQENTKEFNIIDPAIDSWITAKIETKIFLDKNIRSVNYNVKTISKVVYLTGIAQDQDEMDRVINIINELRNVKKIINHVRIKSDPARTKQ